MSISHTIAKSWSGSSGQPISGTVTLTGVEEINFSFALAANTTNQQESLAFTKTDLQSIFIYSDSEEITIKTNSSTAPQDTLTVAAGDPYVWEINSGLPNPFAGNVASAFFTNAQSASTNVSIRCLTNG